MNVYDVTNIEYFESGDVQHSDEVVPRKLRRKRLVDFLHQPVEKTSVYRLLEFWKLIELFTTWYWTFTTSEINFIEMLIIKGVSEQVNCKYN